VWSEALGIRGFWIGVAAMIVVVTGANIAVQFPINNWLTYGAFVYPVSFLVTDLSNRALGPGLARKVVYVGFALGVLLSALFAGWRIAFAPRCSSPWPSPGQACRGSLGASAITA
jgi:uncharacterized PurR-regulated membrane protein YhhQ (DUF165 family)